MPSTPVRTGQPFEDHLGPGGVEPRHLYAGRFVHGARLRHLSKRILEGRGDRSA